MLQHESTDGRTLNIVCIVNVTILIRKLMIDTKYMHAYYVQFTLLLQAAAKIVFGDAK